MKAKKILYWTTPGDSNTIMLAAFDEHNEQIPELQGQCPIPQSQWKQFLELNKDMIAEDVQIERLG